MNNFLASNFSDDNISGDTNSFLFPFYLYSSNVTGVPSNVSYSKKILISNYHSLISAVQHDYCAPLFNYYRRANENFRKCNCVIMDIDNSHSDNPNDWVTPKFITLTFKNVAFAVHFSRNHMKVKNGKEPRPRFHVIFPIDEITSPDEYSAITKSLADFCPVFDKKSLDPAHFFIGTPSPEVELLSGKFNLSTFLKLRKKDMVPASTKADTQPQEIMPDTTNDSFAEDDGFIHEGERNSSLLNFAVNFLKQFGDSSAAYQNFLDNAARCKPPLEKEELCRIWENALKFYNQDIATREDYIEPEIFNQSQRLFAPPNNDFTDLGQAAVFAQLYRHHVRYSDATSFITFNGQVWEESEAKAKKFVQELTDKQKQEADCEIQHAEDMLAKQHALDIVIKFGIKKAAGQMVNENQRAALQLLSRALRYKEFVKSYRKDSSVNSVLKSVQPSLFFDVMDLDNNPFLLNTPSGTVDLHDGSILSHNSDNLITKITAVVPDEKNMDIWLEAVNTFFCGNNELIEYVQEIAGLAAVGKVFDEGLVICCGDGCNGKSTFWNSIAAVLGSYAGTLSSSILTLGYRGNIKHELAETRGKRLVIAAELEEGTSLSTAAVKKLCSTDRIHAEKKFKSPFDFVPTHTLILYTNHLPNIGASDNGTWRRIRLVPFKARIQPQDDIKNYSSYLVENAGGAILSWVIDGAVRIINKEFKLSTPQVVAHALTSYRQDNDSIDNFINECCEVDDILSIPSGIFKRAYLDFCHSIGSTPKNDRELYHYLEARWFSKKRNSRGSTIFGISLKQAS